MCSAITCVCTQMNLQGTYAQRLKVWRTAAEAAACKYPAAGSRAEPTKLQLEEPVAERNLV